MTPNRIGQQLGNYRLIRLLGGGGFAHVYLGVHVRLNTNAAIKVLHTQLAAADIASFLTEAQTIANLEHPHIVRVLDFDVAEGVPFLVMSYAPNGTLRQLHPKGTQLPLPTVVSYVKQLAEALQYAHDEKLIHRDVKPENMLVGRRNEVLLSDFGIALIAQSSRYQSTQEMIGTIAYMSPEQIQGKPRPASDQYSLAIAVYEWLCGDRPFHGSFTELCTQHMFATPAPLRQRVPMILPDVEHIVLTALAKDPKQRFGSVKAFATAFEQASQAGQGQISAGMPQSPFQPLSPSPEGLSQSVVSPTLFTSGPTFPSQQDGSITRSSSAEFAQTGRPGLHTPLPESKGAPSPTLSTAQPAPALSFERPSHHRGLSRPKLGWKVVLFALLALLIVGSTGLIYNVVGTYHAQVQATATALASARAYDTFVAANGIMSGFDAAHTGFNPYEQTLSPSNVSKLTQAWTYPVVGGIISSPTVANGVVYVGSLDNSLYALDARSGTKLWSFATRDAIRSLRYVIHSSPAVANGVVYVGSLDNSLYALDARSGTKLWSFPTGDVIISSPTVADGVVYISSYDHSLYALDARSGTKLWSFATGSFIYSSPSSPAVANGVVYVGSDDGSLYALDAHSGRKLWNFTTRDPIRSSPAVAGGGVYISSDDHSLYALDAHSGRKLWSFAMGNVGSSPAVAGGVVYVGSLDNSLYALDARSGRKLWSFATGDAIFSSPAIANGVVYVGSDDGKLYAFHLK